MITILGIPVPLTFVVVPALVVAVIAAAVSWAMGRFTQLSGFGLKAASVLATELLVAAILAAVLFASSRDLHHPEAKTGFTFAVFYLGIAWVVSFLVSIPSVLLAVAHLVRR